jgi:hypothetical protein
VVSCRRPGLSAARNSGIAASTGALLICMDDDCRFAPDYFDVVARVFSTPDVAIMGGRLLLADPQAARIGIDEDATRWRLSRQFFLAPGTFQCANFAVRRSVIAHVGGFDERLGAGTPYRIEDAEFVARALAAGFVALHEPDAIVYHDHGRSATSDLAPLVRLNRFANGAYFALLLARHRHRVVKPIVWYLLHHGAPMATWHGAACWIRDCVMGGGAGPPPPGSPRDTLAASH